MSIVQVALSFAVEIWKFHNIDLFHQGAFQIRSYFKNNGSSPVLVETPKIWDRAKNTNFPECINKSYISTPDPKMNVPAKAVSKSVLIIYKEESLRMYDIFEQTMHLQIDALMIEELIYKSEIVLVVELWFGEKKNDIIEEMKFVCERQLKVHLIPSQGLHHHVTVIFDYYYLAAVELVVHASLVSISPCYLRLPQSSTNEADANFEKNVSLYQSWHSILFNSAKNCGRRHTACLVHNDLCKILLAVIDSLMGTFQEALSFLNPDQKSRIDDKLQAQLCPAQSKSRDWIKFSPHELERLAFIVQSQTSEDDIADQASIDITKLSSKIVVLFNEYLKTVSFQPAYVESLSLRTHKLRIKRFSEAFFFQEFSIVHLLAVYDPNISSHESLAAKVRDSVYYRRLPPLPIECPDTDGESHDQPIILEEIFIPESRRSSKATCNVKRSDSGSSSDADGSRVLRREGSIYKKKRASGKFETGSIPVIRKLNPTFNRKNLPIQQKKVNLVGYRSVDCSAFDDNLHRTAPGPLKADDAKSSRIGIGTLKTVNGLSCFRGSEDYRDDIEMIKNMSRSMPDLSHIGSKVKLRKKTGDNKKSYHRFSSIYELEETQSWMCIGRRDLSQSNGNLAGGSAISAGAVADASDGHQPQRRQSQTVSVDDKDDDRGGDQLTIVEMLSSSRLQRPASAYVFQTHSVYSNIDTNDSVSNNSSFSIQHHNPQLQTDHKLISRSTELSSFSTTISSCPTQPETILNEQVTFHQLKAKLMADLSPQFQGNVYSEMNNIPASKRPYFSLRDRDDIALANNATILHYIICVHGLDGEHRDLRLVKAYLSLALPEQRFEFLMSDANEQDTFADLDSMKDRLVDEILDKITDLREQPHKISFIGHSLGCLLIRAAIASPRMAPLIPKFHTFLSLGGPHLGTVYGSSVLVNVGLWVMQKVRKSICLQQLAMKDCPTDLRQTYLYNLSGQSGLEYFRYVLLASSPQDRYVPYHSTRIELCKAAVKDNSEMGVVYMEMVTRILQRLLRSGKTTVIRYDAHYTLPRSANNYIGRAAHIALIDSELFLEKFICVSAAKYFR